MAPLIQAGPDQPELGRGASGEGLSRPWLEAASSSVSVTWSPTPRVHSVAPQEGPRGQRRPGGLCRSLELVSYKALFGRRQEGRAQAACGRRGSGPWVPGVGLPAAFPPALTLLDSSSFFRPRLASRPPLTGSASASLCLLPAPLLLHLSNGVTMPLFPLVPFGDPGEPQGAAACIVSLSPRPALSLTNPQAARARAPPPSRPPEVQPLRQPSSGAPLGL